MHISPLCLFLYLRRALPSVALTVLLTARLLLSLLCSVSVCLLLLSVPASGIHIGLMIVLRHIVYGFTGGDYDGGAPLVEIVAYEYRKDLVTYAALVLLPPVVRGLLQERRGAQARPDDFRLEVRDGSRTVRLLPADIEWAQAAGNYVELFGAFGALLHRRTLAALEGELAPYGFRRIHRARIVRTGAVRAIEARPSGDFEVVLASGVRLAGSRRYRDQLG